MIEFCAKTDIGLKRKKNDDFFLTVMDPSADFDTGLMGQLLAVADGMGGHPAGDVASQIACERFRECYYDISKIRRYLYAGSARVTCDPLIKHIIHAFTEAHKGICCYECDHDKCAGLGTTLSVLVFKGERAFIGHVGDSRIYRFRDGQLELLTKDHTFVQDLLDYGDITPEEARESPMRHVLMQSMGQGLEEVYARCERLMPGDIFLLCTDGLHDMISDDAIKDVLKSGASIEKACDMLVEEALDNGGRDNVTVIAARYEKP